jgi:hypothetical protein
VSGDVHLVFSAPPDGVSEDEFNAWYDAHLAEILSVPGFRSARRFRLKAVVGAEEAPPYRYLVVYEIDGDPDAALRALEDASMGSAELYTELKSSDEGALPLPPWFEDVRFASWNGYALGPRVDA